MLHCSGPQIPGFPAHPCRPSADWKRNPEHAVTIFIYVFSSLEIMHGFWNLKRNPAKPTAVPRQFSDLWQKKSRETGSVKVRWWKKRITFSYATLG